LKLERKLVFIVGEPRSGTTWLMWLLARHPSVAASFHSSLFHALKPLRQWWTKEVPYGKTVHTHTGNAQDPVSEIKLNGLLSFEKFIELVRPLASHVFDQIASCGSDVRVVVEDTPENLEFLQWILQIFPDAYVLHIIRDPRSVFSSQRAAAYSWVPPRIGRIATNPVLLARSWRAYLELGGKVRKKTSRYREIHYEKLLSNGAQELAAIFAWLELPADDALVQSAVEAGAIDSLKKKDLPKGFVRKGSAEGWRGELSKRDIRAIEYIAGDQMERLGYELVMPRGRKPFQVRRHEFTTEALRKTNTFLRRMAVVRVLRRVPILKRMLEAMVETQ
jgi:hypothetical protein